MRVLHVSSGNMFGGIETLLVTLARYRTCAPDMEPEFALVFEGRVSRELRETGVEVHMLSAVRASRPWTVWRARRALRAVLKARRYDMVVCHAPWPHAIFGPVVKRAGLPLVFWMHNDVAERHWIERWAARTVPDRVLANSQFTANTVDRIFPGREPATVLHNPVVMPEDENASAKESEKRRLAQVLGFDHADVVILQVSRLEPWKGHEVLLRALTRVASQVSWTCVLVGYPQSDEERRYRDRLHTLVGELRLGARVRFHESHSDISSVYRAADVFCQPNLTPEPFGIVFIEAMLCGLPIVTSATGGPAEILDGSCATCTPARDVQALADALTWLIDAPDDRTRMGAAGRSRAKELCDPAQQLPRLARELSLPFPVTR